MNKTICFCFAFPLNSQSFSNAIDDKRKDFIPHFFKFYQKQQSIVDWNLYSDKIVEPYRLIKNRFSKYEVDFIDECTFSDFKNVVNNLSYKVIILFSHCINNGKNNESIEFFDELVMSENMLPFILDSERIYDFSVCKPEYLKKLMKDKRRKAVCGTSTEFIPVILWIYIYAEVFTIMRIEQVDFLEAMHLIKRRYRNYKPNNDE